MSVDSVLSSAKCKNGPQKLELFLGPPPFVIRAPSRTKDPKGKGKYLCICATLAKRGGAEGDVQMRRRNALSAPSVVQRMIVADCKVLSGPSLTYSFRRKLHL